MTDGCGILFNLSFNTLVFAKFRHHESFPNHFNFNTTDTDDATEPITDRQGDITVDG
jgi:hypothetical protein